MQKSKNYRSTSDSLIWNELCKGNEHVFQRVYEEYVQVLFDYGIHFTPDGDLVKDCIQEIFIDIYRNRKTLGKTNNIKFYLFKALKRKIIRKMSIDKIIPYDDINQIPFSIIYSTEDEIIYNEKEKEKKEKLQKAINKLPPRQKEALFLRYVEGMEYEDICEILDMNYQSIRNLVSRALSKLRSIYSDSLILFLTSI